MSGGGGGIDDDGMNFILGFLENSQMRNCIDIGCASGSAMRKMAPHFQHDYCFEIRSEIIDKLKNRTMKHNINNATIFENGLSDSEREVFIELPENTNKTNVIDPKSLKCLTHLSNPIRKVIVYPLDKYNIVDVDFIKIDVEGHELEVIRGAIETLKKFKPVLFMEVISRRTITDDKRRKELFGILESLQYKFKDIRQLDMVFV